DGMRGRLHPHMAATDSATHQILSLSEQLDAMLLGWLERRAGRVNPAAGAVAVAVLTVGEKLVPEVEKFGAKWSMRVDRLGVREQTVTLRVSGAALPVMGFADITAMYRA